ncbi:MAG TPA: HAMP domain-containing sensor histidine kinase [Mariprofundaceae bacterium]|nr:HAMP domain-containing sensor histidine kinase [Mariprofundaceae bacterium]
MLILRRLLHSFAYFAATVAAMAVFVLVLMVAESLLYWLTGHPVSVWAMVLAAISAAFGFAPLAQALQRWLDNLFFRQHIDSLAAIRHLGAGDLAQLPVQDIEPALLERICKVSLRRYVALDERSLPEGRLHVFPENAPVPDGNMPKNGYELRLPLPRGSGEAFLSFGPRRDGWPTDPEELAGLQSLARFAAMSLEHARLTHQQAEAARLDSLSRVTQQLHSHDLKNRLHDLAFLAHHIESGELDKEDLQRLVSAIRKVTGRMQMLMQRLSDPRAPLHPALAPLDMVSLLGISIRDRLWPEGVKVGRKIPPLPPASGDSELLRGVFDNLYDNAVQAMQGKGVLTVAASLVRDEGEWIEVRVSDTGQGIDPDFLKHRLFRLFGTNKPSGLGVGLYLSRRIILAHGGTIAAESAGVGKGCTFIVRLPAWQDGAATQTEGNS